MKLDEIENIIKKSNPSDWENIEKVEMDGLNEYVYKNDISIKLVAKEIEPFDEDWLAIFPDKKAFKFQVSIIHEGLVVKNVYLVYVDGGRNMLPLPRPDENLKTCFNDLEIAIGQIYSQPSNNFNSQLNGVCAYIDKNKMWG